jgi:hypothetical protein
VMSAVKDLAHAFIDLDDFENAGACVVQLLQLQIQHDRALYPNPPQEA